VGAATVDVGPRVAGRIESIPVRLGDRVEQGQLVVKVEDRELRQQVSQVQANLEVNKATVTARQNDAKVTTAALERARTSEERGLISRAALEDAEARHNSAVSQVAVAEAQLVSVQARLDELKITLSNTNVVSPVDGFVGRRNLDPGAFAGTNTAVLSLVDISTVRLIANIVEKDFKRIVRGAQAVVEVDAFPGERFTGQVSRVSPVFDPATRTATIEIEVANPGFRLKPGMYARVRLMAEHRTDALAVPRAAVVDVGGRRGVYLVDGETARFRDVRTGLSDDERIEVVDGIEEGARVVTMGALAIRDGERIAPVGGAGGRRGRGDTSGAASPPADRP
jgi:RND family efflux transporter MFP subunit